MHSILTSSTVSSGCFLYLLACLLTQTITHPLTCVHLMQVLHAQIKTYVPKFSGAFEHVCIHTGGRGVIDEIEKQLTLPADKMEPSRATLYRYGNLSSSSIWCATALPGE